jgi:hypothetical protein
MSGKQLVMSGNNNGLFGGYGSVSWYQYILAASYDAGAPVLPGAWTLRPLEFKILVVENVSKGQVYQSYIKVTFKIECCDDLEYANLNGLTNNLLVGRP